MIPDRHADILSEPQLAFEEIKLNAWAFIGPKYIWSK